MGELGFDPDEGYWIRDALYIVSSLLHLTFTASLIPLLVTPGWCISPTEVEWVVNKSSGTAIWRTAILVNCTLSFAFESSFMSNVFFFRRNDNRTDEAAAIVTSHVAIYTIVYFFVIPTVLLEVTVPWLYEVSGGSDSVWDFGQILAFVTVIFATGAVIGSYLIAVSPVDPSVRGYHIFWNDGSSHRIHESNLSMCQCEKITASSGPTRRTSRGNNSR